MKIIQKGLFRVCFQPITMLNCCTTCISWEIGSYNTKQSRHNEHTHFCRNFVAKSAIWFSKDEGGVKGRLELFRSFIRFGDAVCPLVISQLAFWYFESFWFMFSKSWWQHPFQLVSFLWHLILSRLYKKFHFKPHPSENKHKLWHIKRCGNWQIFRIFKY